jgi:SAM-dependent methyltransferase
MNRKEHWEHVYASKPTDRLGWYKPSLETSLAWIRELGLKPDAPIIDVGCGASTLVDELLHEGYRAITALDISQQALSALRGRLGEREAKVKWLIADITRAELPREHYELWHDRAVFHFLIEAKERRRYRDKLLTALQPDGHLIIGVFAPEAPSKCSGLPVARYDHERLANTVGNELELIRHHKEMHITPGGVEQMYLYCLFRRRP